MKTILRCATMLAGLTALSLSATSAQGQGAGPTRASGKIAVIDVSKIFKEHQRFRAHLEDIRKDIETAEAALRKDRDEIVKMAEQLKRYNIGTPDYKRLEEQIATRQAQLQLKMNLQKRGFMEEEAKVYFNVYKEIELAVKDFAQPRGIDLVLRYQDIEMDNPEDRQKTIMGVNKAVVYHNNIDITGHILRMLNPPDNTPPGPGPGGRGLVPSANGGFAPSPRR